MEEGKDGDDERVKTKLVGKGKCKIDGKKIKREEKVNKMKVDEQEKQQY